MPKVQMDIETILPQLFDRVGMFRCDLPEFVHPDVSFCALHQMAVHDSCEQYFFEAPDGYADDLGEHFPVIGEYIGKSFVETEGELISIPIEVMAEAILPIQRWAHVAYSDFLRDVRAGAVFVARDPETQRLELRKVRH